MELISVEVCVFFCVQKLKVYVVNSWNLQVGIVQN